MGAAHPRKIFNLSEFRKNAILCVVCVTSWRHRRVIDANTSRTYHLRFHLGFDAIVSESLSLRFAVEESRRQAQNVNIDSLKDFLPRNEPFVSVSGCANCIFRTTR